MYGILTFHRALNAGALLQCYALQNALDGLGMENAVVDYRNGFIERQHHPYTLYRGSVVKCAGRAVVLGPVLAKRVRKFDGFVEQYIKTSKPYQSLDQLNEDAGAYTAFITGSDQVFSVDCASFDPAYFLGFPGADGKKYSYAASVGKNDVPESFAAEFGKRLSSFPFLSLREEAAAALVRDKLKLGVPVESHIDPVLFYDGEFWKKLAKKPKEKGYVFLYTMLPSATIAQKAVELGKRLSLPVLWADDRYYKRVPGISRRLAVSPDELLGYIAGAEAVVTNSFHGTAFSVLFEKRFSAEAAHEKSSRVTALLSLLGLETENLGGETDWGAVREKLESERARAREYLLKVRNIAESK